ncbi:MAG: hypothetical protein FWC94_00615 [Bacteroidales bacterium]|nr:hypothetical protein [Bacteroidales bacterium]
MKKIILTLGLISFAVILQAQWFVGGNFGYKHDFERDEGSHMRTTQTFSEFSLAPMFGYQINDRFAIGANIGFVWNKTTEKSEFLWGQNWTTSYEHEATTGLFGIQPFVRYTFVEFGRFSVFANIKAHFFIGSIERPHTYYLHWSGPGWQWPPTPHTVMVKYNMNSFGINITPALSFSLSKRINLEASLNFMNLGWNRTSMRRDEAHRDDKIIERNFGVGVNAANVVDVGVISVGFIYKFGGSTRELRVPDGEPRAIRTGQPRPPRPGRVVTVPSL